MIIPPKNETIWVQYLKDGELKYIITSTNLRDIYYLYEVVDGKLKKTKHKEENPLDLDRWVKYE